MIRNATLPIAGPLVRQARLYAKLSGLDCAETVVELALIRLFETDPRIAEADAVLEQAKAKAWRELNERWKTL